MALRLPWLALPPDKENPALTLLSPTEGQKYDIHLPAPLGPECQGTLLVSSSHGWLIVFEYCQDHQRIRLMNPFTEKAINLPFLPWEYMKTFHKAIILTPPKVTAANDWDCVVLAILEDHSVAFCRPRDHEWSSLDFKGACKDIAFCKEFLYCLIHQGEIVTFEIGDEVTVKGFHSPSSCVTSFYLVGSGSRVLLAACEFVYNHYGGCNCMVDEIDEEDGLELCKCSVLFQIFEMNERLSKWIEMKTLENDVLFVGGGDYILMNAANWPSMRGNCIYFTDDCYGELELDWGVSSLYDGNVTKCRVDSSMPLRGPSMWVRLNG